MIIGPLGIALYMGPQTPCPQYIGIRVIFSKLNFGASEFTRPLSKAMNLGP